MQRGHERSVYKYLLHVNIYCTGWMKKVARFPFSNNPTMLSYKKDVAFVEYSRFSV